MPIPERFGRYRVTGTLGTGAMGEVFAATDEALGRDVAIKVLKSQRNELAARMLDERFRQEARAIASLTHPNVVVVFDIGLDADPPYLVMERVAGPSLKERLATGALAEPEVRALGIQIARALAAAHERGIVHRDVKPANILVAGDQSWKLADFGVAHVPDSSLTMTGQFIGSPAYAPPEALLRGQCDREGDVFGLGAVLYHAVTGAWPRLEQTTGALLAPLPPVRTTATVSEELAAIIDRAVAIEPASRPSASDLAAALAHAAIAHPSGASLPSNQAVPSNSALASNPALPNQAVPSNPALASRSHSSASHASASHASGASLVSNSALAANALAADARHSMAARDATPLPLPLGSQPGVPLDSTSHGGVPIAPVRWKPFAIGGAIFILVVILIGATRGGSSTGSSPSAGPGVQGGPAEGGRDPAHLGAPVPPPQGPIQIADPPMPGGKSEKDWNKVIEHIERGHYREARKKLGEWERKYGATTETESLHTQLESRADVDAPDERGPPGHRRNDD